MITVSAEAIAAELTSLGVQSIQMRDSKYACPDDAWLDQFAKWFLSQIPARALGDEGFDCDDCVLRAVDRATDSLRLARLDNGCGHSLGMCDLTIPTWNDSGDELPGLNGVKSSKGHCTCLVRTATSLKFYEPQTGLHCDALGARGRGLVGVLLWCRM